MTLKNGATANVTPPIASLMLNPALEIRYLFTLKTQVRADENAHLPARFDPFQ